MKLIKMDLRHLPPGATAKICCIPKRRSHWTQRITIISIKLHAHHAHKLNLINTQAHTHTHVYIGTHVYNL